MIETIKLKNGITIVHEQIPFVRSIAFGIFVKNGSRNESQATNGISHFIEHMLFKGTKTRRAIDIADEMDAIGGQLNAYTTKEYTCYYTRVLDTHFDIALDVLSDMFFHSKFDDVEIQKERGVILEEISMYEDTPEDLVYDNLQYALWHDHPLGFPILGNRTSIASFDNSTFQDYYKKHYRPDNTVIAVAGNFDADEMIKKIECYFGDFTCTTEQEGSGQAATLTPSFIKTVKDIEQVHMCLAFPGIRMGTDDSYVLSVFNTIFGGGMSSRLFQKIREEHGLSYSIYSYNSNYVDTGLFSVYAGLNPNQTQEVLQLILQEIKNLQHNKITEEQLTKTKEQIKSNMLLSLESSSSRMSSIGRSELLLNRILTTDQLAEKVDSVTIPRIYALVDSIFDLNKASLSIVGKVENFDAKEIFSDAYGKVFN